MYISRHIKKYGANEMLEAQIIIEKLRDNSIETELLKSRYLRELYKILGDPSEKDFPEVYKYRRYWEKERGWTKYIYRETKNYMTTMNAQGITWNVQRPSQTKINIAEDYAKNNWNVSVGAYNVQCVKYIKHPKYDNLWVRFYVSRDCNKYEYVLEDK